MKSTKSSQSNFSEQPPHRHMCTSRIVPLLLLWMLPAGLGLMLAGRVTGQTFTSLHNFSSLSNSAHHGDSDGATPQAGLLLSSDTLYRGSPNSCESPYLRGFARGLAELKTVEYCQKWQKRLL
jgi:hypothetical protein